MNCIICGKEIEKSRYSGSTLCSEECFTENYWREILKNKNKYLIIKGVCYSLGNDHAKVKGFGGARFHLWSHDYRDIYTSNLWMQGEIPEKFREYLPDNATFVKVYHIDGNSRDYKKAQSLWDETVFHGRVDLFCSDGEESLGMDFFYEDERDWDILESLEKKLK